MEKGLSFYALSRHATLPYLRMFPGPEALQKKKNQQALFPGFYEGFITESWLAKLLGIGNWLNLQPLSPPWSRDGGGGGVKLKVPNLQSGGWVSWPSAPTLGWNPKVTSISITMTPCSPSTLRNYEPEAYMKTKYLINQNITIRLLNFESALSPLSLPPKFSKRLSGGDSFFFSTSLYL